MALTLKGYKPHSMWEEYTMIYKSAPGLNNNQEWIKLRVNREKIEIAV